jgi:hypothetical protein
MRMLQALSEAGKLAVMMMTEKVLEVPMFMIVM